RLGRGQGLFGAAERRLAREIELAVLEAGHLREASAERIEPHDVGIHLAETERERVEIPLKRVARPVENRLLVRDFRAPGIDPAGGIADAEELGGLEAAVEHAGADEQRNRNDADPRAAGVQAYLAQVPSLFG